MITWLVVSTHLKNISQIGSFSNLRNKNKKYLSCHHPVTIPPPSFHRQICTSPPSTQTVQKRRSSKARLSPRNLLHVAMPSYVVAPWYSNPRHRHVQGTKPRHEVPGISKGKRLGSWLKNCEKVRLWQRIFGKVEGFLIHDLEKKKMVVFCIWMFLLMCCFEGWAQK